MDFNNYNENNQPDNSSYHTDQPQPSNQQTPPVFHSTEANGMAVAAMILGIISIVSCCCIYLSFITGAIGIILGVLSKGGEPRIHSTAKIGIILSIVGMSLSVVIIIAAVLINLSTYTSGEFWNEMQQYMEMYETDLTL